MHLSGSQNNEARARKGPQTNSDLERQTVETTQTIIRELLFTLINHWLVGRNWSERGLVGEPTGWPSRIFRK